MGSGGVYTNLTLYPDRKFLNRVQLNLSIGQRDGYFSNVVQDRYVRTRLHLRFTEFNMLDATVYSGMERFADTDFKKTTLDIESQFGFIS